MSVVDNDGEKIVPLAGEISGLGPHYDRVLYAFTNATQGPLNEMRMWNRMTILHARLLALEIEKLYHVDPFDLTSHVDESSFTLSGLQLASEYVVQEFPHPTDPALHTFEPDFLRTSVNLLFTSVVPQKFTYEDPETVDVDELGSPLPTFVEDAYLVGMDFEDVMYPNQPRRRTYVPLDGIKVLNRSLPEL